MVDVNFVVRSSNVVIELRHELIYQFIVDVDVEVPVEMVGRTSEVMCKVVRLLAGVEVNE